MKKILLIIASVLLISSLVINRTTAEGDGSSTSSATFGVAFENPLNADNVWELINNLIDFIYTISIPLLVIVVLWAGFTMITSGGKPENFKKGQNILLYAAIGFGIILLSKGVAYIVSDILNAGNIPPQEVEPQSEEPLVPPYDEMHINKKLKSYKF